MIYTIGHGKTFCDIHIYNKSCIIGAVPTKGATILLFNFAMKKIDNEHYYLINWGPMVVLEGSEDDKFGVAGGTNFSHIIYENLIGQTPYITIPQAIAIAQGKGIDRYPHETFRTVQDVVVSDVKEMFRIQDITGEPLARGIRKGFVIDNVTRKRREYIASDQITYRIKLSLTSASARSGGGTLFCNGWEEAGSALFGKTAKELFGTMEQKEIVKIIDAFARIPINVLLKQWRSTNNNKSGWTMMAISTEEMEEEEQYPLILN